MEKQKKEAKVWYIAATHWITAAFVMPLIIGFIGLTLIGLAMQSSPLIAKQVLLLQALMLAITALGIYVGVMYSTKYIKKTYIIKNASDIIKQATIFAVILIIVLLGVDFYKEGLISLFQVVDRALAIVLFYVFSKKYLV